MKIREEEERKRLKELSKPKELTIHEKIALELEKIRELDERRRKEIERENKKKELMRSIQNEIRKIQDLDGKKDEEDQVPTWVKLVTDAQKRKEYREKQCQKEKEIEKIDDEKVETDETPRWIKMIQERRIKNKQVQESKDVDDKQPPMVLDDKQKQMVLDDKPPMTFEETVEAMLSLLDDEETEEDKSFTRENKIKSPEVVTIKKVSNIKDKFEQIQDSLDKLQDNEYDKKVTKDKISKMKNLLFSSKETTSKPNDGTILSGKRQIINKIKNMFETGEENENKTAEKPLKRRKSIIQVPSNFLHQQTSNADIPDKKQIKWSYKEKSATELYKFVLNSNKTDNEMPQNKIEKAQEINREIENDEKVQDSSVDEYSELIHQVSIYLNNDTENNDFKDTLTGYLNLIQDDDYDKPEAIKTKPKNLTLTNVRKLKSQLQEDEEVNKGAVRNNIKVGKLNVELMEESLNGNNDDKKTSNKIVSQDLCSSVKEALKDKMNKDEIPIAPIRRKQKLIVVPTNEDSFSIG